MMKDTARGCLSVCATALFATPALPIATGAASLNEIMERGHITIATEDNYAPSRS